MNIPDRKYFLGPCNILGGSELRAQVMIEQSAYCFGKILDQLRQRALAMPGAPPPPPPVVAADEDKNFRRVVAYYFPGVEDFILGAV